MWSESPLASAHSLALDYAPTAFSRLVFQNVQLLTSSDKVFVRSLSLMVGTADSITSRVFPRLSTAWGDGSEGSIIPLRRAAIKM
jgi:hypothetical protein